MNILIHKEIRRQAYKRLADYEKNPDKYKTHLIDSKANKVTVKEQLIRSITNFFK